MYMFRAISCSSSGGQIVLIQHLVSSLSVSDRQVLTGFIIPDDCIILTQFYFDVLVLIYPFCITNFDVLLTVHLSITLANESDDTRCCINTIRPPEDEQDIARNMYMWRIVINILKNLCTKLVIG
jgi:hypothetical protein